MYFLGLIINVHQSTDQYRFKNHSTIIVHLNFRTFKLIV